MAIPPDTTAIRALTPGGSNTRPVQQLAKPDRLALAEAAKAKFGMAGPQVISVVFRRSVRNDTRQRKLCAFAAMETG